MEFQTPACHRQLEREPADGTSLSSLSKLINYFKASQQKLGGISNMVLTDLWDVTMPTSLPFPSCSA